MDTAAPESSSFWRRVFGALRLDSETYEEVAGDVAATAQAFAVVTVSCLIYAIPVGMERLSQIAHSVQNLVVILPLVMLFGLLVRWIGWTLWAALLSVVASGEIRGPAMAAGFRRLLRAQGFAAAPELFAIFRLVPTIGPAIFLAVLLWTFVAGIVAIRAALGVTTGRALGIILRAWIVIGGLLLVAIVLTAIARGVVG